MSKFAWFGISLALVASVLLLWLRQSDRAEATIHRESGSLSVKRLSPGPEAGDEIESDSAAMVKFCYQLKNTSHDKIDGLKLDLSCGCEATAPVPTEISPDGTATVCFQLRAARFGTVQRVVHLLASGSPQPVATFPVTLRVPFQPPMLLQEGEPVELRFVATDSTPRELVFNTIEVRDSQPWLEGLSIAPNDLAEVQSVTVDELREPDPTLVRRGYRFRMEARALAIGRHSGTLRFKAREADKPAPEPVYFAVDVLDRVSIVPNPLVIRIAPDGAAKPARAVAVFRNSEGTAQLQQYDDSLLEIRPASRNTGRAISFTVAPIAQGLVDDRDTSVIVDVGNGETRQLQVLLRVSHGE